MKSLLIIDADQHLEVEMGSSQILLWNYSDDLTCQSILSYVEKNSDYVRGKYLKFIFDMGESKNRTNSLKELLKIDDNLSFWWMTIPAKKINYLPESNVKDCLKLIALELYIKNKNINDIKIRTKNPLLIDALKIFCADKGIVLTWQSILLQRLSFKLNYLIELIISVPKALAWIILYSIECHQYVKKGRKNFSENKKNINFFTYFSHVDKDRKEINFNYWGNLPKVLSEKGIGANWLHIYVRRGFYGAHREVINHLHFLNKKYKDQNHFLLESFMGFDVISKGLINAYKIYNNIFKINKVLISSASGIYCNYLFPFAEYDLKRSFNLDYLIKKLVSHNLLEKFCLLLNNDSASIYLQENQSWELSLIYLRRKHKINSLVGYPHTTIRYWDLRYFHDKNAFIDRYFPLPIPNKIAINGAASLNHHLKSGYPASMLVKVEATRYSKRSSFAVRLRKDNEIKLLILGDYLSENTRSILDILVAAVPGIEGRIRLVLKPHPSCAIDYGEYEDILESITHEQLSLIIGDFDAVFCSSLTSSAVDAYLFGVKVFALIDKKNVNTSPLRSSSDVIFILNSQDLSGELNNLENLNNTMRKEDKQYFYLDDDLPGWKVLFDKLTQEACV